MSEAPRPLSDRHRVRLVSPLAMATLALASAALLASACSGSVSNATNPHACADLAIKAITTNAVVKGLWNCLDSNLQNSLHTYGYDGDGAFSDGTGKTPPVFATHYVGTANGVAVYTVILKFNNGTLKTDVLSVWLDASGKVSNVGVDSGDF